MRNRNSTSTPAGAGRSQMQPELRLRHPRGQGGVKHKQSFVGAAVSFLILLGFPHFALREKRYLTAQQTSARSRFSATLWAPLSPPSVTTPRHAGKQLPDRQELEGQHSTAGVQFESVATLWSGGQGDRPSALGSRAYGCGQRGCRPAVSSSVASHSPTYVQPVQSATVTDSCTLCHLRKER